MSDLPSPPIAAIQARVCARCAVPLIEMRSKRQARSVARPRHDDQELEQDDATIDRTIGDEA